MITIEIKNAEKLIKEEKGKLISGMGKLFDLEKMVEKRIIKEIKESFNNKGIEAEINIQ